MKRRFLISDIRKMCIVGFLCSISQFISSAYLSNVPMTLTQPDGSKLECFASGDEFYNWLHDENGFTIIQDSETGYYCYAILSGEELVASKYIVGKISPESVGLTPKINISHENIQKKADAFFAPLKASGVYSQKMSKSPKNTGHINNIVIYIRFADQDNFEPNQNLYSEMFNDIQGVSMRNYFAEASYGKLDIETHFYPANNGTTILSYKASHNRDYYCPYNANTNPNGYKSQASREHELLTDAIHYVKSQIPSSLNVDFDNDGYVDNICFIIKGGVTAYNTLLWPHKWSLYSQIVKINGKRVYNYNVQLEDRLNSNQHVGVLCHEMGHTLGAPDLYHKSGNGQPVGIWDIMASDQKSPQHMCVYLKNKYLGWISSIPTIVGEATYTLNPSTYPTDNCCKLAIEGSSEYLVLEYRKRTGLFETSLPNSGLVIYRINEAHTGNFSGTGYGGVSDEVYVFRPGGSINSDGILSQACFSDAFNRTTFSNSTNPFCFTSNNNLGNVCICNIKELSNGKLSFEVKFCDGGDITYTNTSNLPPTTKACNSITTSGNVTVKQNESITFIAGEEIILNPGFTMENNSSLELYIQ